MQKRNHRLLSKALHVLIVFSLCACNSNTHDSVAKHNHSHTNNEKPEDPNNKAHAGHHHEAGSEIILEPEQAKQFGVTTETVKPGTFNNIVKVSGQILDSPDAIGVVVAPTAGVVVLSAKAIIGTHMGIGSIIATITPKRVSGGDPNAAARASLKAAQAEVNRLKPLKEHGIVSQAEYNRAVADLEVARAAYSPTASSGVATAPITGTLTQLLVSQGQYVEAGSPIANISGSGKLTLRADLPQKYYSQISTFNSAKIKTPYSNEIIDISTYGGTRSNAGQAVSTSAGYIPVYFSLKNDGTLIPGSYIEVYLLGAERNNVITIPVSAISEQQDNYFVYIRLDKEGYLKIPVRLGTRDGERVEVLSGLHMGDNVVVTGTTTVRLAESSNIVPEGHSHNH